LALLLFSVLLLLPLLLPPASSQMRMALMEMDAVERAVVPAAVRCDVLSW
jgi:hypothetical protein